METVTQDGDEIRRRRDAAGLTQEQLAKRVGRSSAYIAQIETRTRVKRISRQLHARLCQALGVREDALLIAGDAVAATDE